MQRSGCRMFQAEGIARAGPKGEKKLGWFESKRRTVWLEQSKHGETRYVMMRSRAVDRSWMTLGLRILF